MASSEELLNRYVSKMLEVQEQQSQRPLSQEELREIAHSIGMSDADWEAAQSEFNARLRSGRELLEYKSWQGAVQQLEQAKALQPYHLEANYLLAKAHLQEWKRSDREEDYQKAKASLDQCLRLQPDYGPALLLVREMEQERVADQQSGKKKMLIILGVAMVLTFIFASYFASTYNTAVSRQEPVKQAWAQVENVFERRASLIPRLTSIAEKENAAQQELIRSLRQNGNTAQSRSLNAELNEQNMQEFLKLQKQLDEQTQRVLESLGGSAYDELRVEISGSENRIRVEIRRYNQEVSAYNQQIRQFPYNLMGFEPMPYYKPKTDR